MSRFCDDYYEPEFPNQYDLWSANVKRALSGKRGQKALKELRAALLALPEKRLISGALCTVGGTERPDVRKVLEKPVGDPWGYVRADMEAKVKSEGEGVCAIGAFLWFKKVQDGATEQEAFDALPTLLDTDHDGMETAWAGKAAGLTLTLAWDLAYRNDEEFHAMTPEERYVAFMKWLDEQIAEAVPA